MAAAGADILDALDGAVVGAHGTMTYGWVSGLDLYADTRWAEFYATAEGATWSQATCWDDVLLRFAQQGD